jgi:hypothetical protein
MIRNLPRLKVQDLKMLKRRTFANDEIAVVTVCRPEDLK